MFIYKFCPKCQKRNHKSHVNCARCGDQLLDTTKFGKSIFAAMLSIVILLSSATVYASKSYYNKKSQNSQPNTQTQNVEPTQEKTNPAVNPEVKQELVKEEVKSEPVVQQTPVKKETTTTPQVTPAPVAAVSCDVSRKSELTEKYNADVNTAMQKRDQLLSEANAEYASAGDRARERYKDIWDPNARGAAVAHDIVIAATALEQARSDANRDYNDTTTYLAMMYNLDMQSAHCSN